MRRVSNIRGAPDAPSRPPSRHPSRHWAAAWPLALAPVLVLAATPAPALADASVGSRIAGSGDSAATVRPVHIITREQIERSGMSTIQELTSSRHGYHYFGFHAPHLIGAVVMIDGRPIPHAQSIFILNSLPVPAVERIEYIGNTAGALYAGNPGGAINIVLRRGFEGAEAWAGAEQPARPGGEIANGGAMWGARVGRGRLTAGVDGLRRAELRDRDRAHSRARWEEGGSFAGTTGVSIGGNTLFLTDGKGTAGTADDTTLARPLGACSGAGYTGVLSRPANIAGTGCGFAWADIAWTDNHHQFGRYNLFADFDHPVRKDMTFHARVRFTQGRAKTVWAPSVGAFGYDLSGSPDRSLLDLRSRLLETVTDLPAELDPDNITGLTVWHRFTGHGARAWTTDLHEYDVATGLRGRLGAQTGYDLQLRSHRVTSLERGRNFVSARLISRSVLDGDYYLADPLNPPEAMAAAHWQAVHDSRLESKFTTASGRSGIRLILDGPAGTLPGGAARWAGGVETDRLKQSEQLSYRGGSGGHAVGDALGGAATASYRGERLRHSAFGEMRLPLHRDWTVALAARHDNYDDAGPTWAYQAAAVYRPFKVLALRASWETGRTPPSLASLNLPPSVSYPRVCDTKTHTGALSDCAYTQVETVSGGNPALEPYPKQTVSIGAQAAWRALALSADWFRIRGRDAPGYLSSQKIVDTDADGGALPPGAAVIRDGDLLTQIVNPILNSVDFEDSGVDVRAGARWKLGELDNGFDLRWLHRLTHDVRVGGVEQSADFIRNHMHATLSAGPGLRGGGWVVDWHIRAAEGRSITDSGDIDTWIGHDLSLTWRDVMGVEGLVLRGGVFNLGDAGPPTDSKNPEARDSRYDAVRGRTFYLAVKASW